MEKSLLLVGTLLLLAGGWSLIRSNQGKAETEAILLERDHLVAESESRSLEALLLVGTNQQEEMDNLTSEAHRLAREADAFTLKAHQESEEANKASERAFRFALLGAILFVGGAITRALDRAKRNATP